MMEREMKQEKETGTLFDTLIDVLDPVKGITAMDYLEALDQVKVLLQTAYLELCESINLLPEQERERADNFLLIQRSAFLLWEQIDKKVMEDHKARAQA